MTTQILDELRDSRRHRLRDLATCGVEPRPGIYALWFGDRLLYVGIARTDPSQTSNPQARGVPGRLGTYVRARLTSDFAVAVAFRFVVPELTADDRSALAAGTMRVADVQARVRTWVFDNIEFTAVLCDGAAAAAAERTARRDGLGGTGPPELNPL